MTQSKQGYRVSKWVTLFSFFLSFFHYSFQSISLTLSPILITLKLTPFSFSFSLSLIYQSSHFFFLSLYQVSPSSYSSSLWYFWKEIDFKRLKEWKKEREERRKRFHVCVWLYVMFESLLWRWLGIDRVCVIIWIDLNPSDEFWLKRMGDSLVKCFRMDELC